MQHEIGAKKCEQNVSAAENHGTNFQENQKQRTESDCCGGGAGRCGEERARRSQELSETRRGRKSGDAGAMEVYFCEGHGDSGQEQKKQGMQAIEGERECGDTDDTQQS